MPKCQHQWKFMSMLTGVLAVNSSQLNPLSPPFFFFSFSGVALSPRCRPGRCELPAAPLPALGTAAP